MAVWQSNEPEMQGMEAFGGWDHMNMHDARWLWWLKKILIFKWVHAKWLPLQRQRGRRQGKNGKKGFRKCKEAHDVVLMVKFPPQPPTHLQPLCFLSVSISHRLSLPSCVSFRSGCLVCVQDVGFYRRKMEEEDGGKTRGGKVCSHGHATSHPVMHF